MIKLYGLFEFGYTNRDDDGVFTRHWQIISLSEKEYSFDNNTSDVPSFKWLSVWEEYAQPPRNRQYSFHDRYDKKKRLLLDGRTAAERYLNSFCTKMKG